MTDFPALLLDFIVRHAAWAGPIVGVLAFLESLVVIGLFIPAIATMIAVGGLIGAGIIEPVPVIVLGIVGAILGDWVSYAIGRAMGPAIYSHRWLRGHRIGFARARLFFRRFGFLAVLLGRFLGPVRATVPVVAGVLRMPHMSFQVANALSGLIWVPGLMLPGYLAGTQAAAMGFEIEYLLPIAFAVCLIPLIGGWIAIRLFSRPRRRENRRS